MLIKKTIHVPWMRIILSILLTVVIATVIRHIPGPSSYFQEDDSSLVAQLVRKTVNALAVMAAYLTVGYFIERASLTRLGLPFKGVWRVLLVSYTLGAMFISCIVSVLAVLGRYRIATVAVNVATMLAELALFFVAALFEEVLYRAVVFRNLEAWLGTWIALATSAVLFGLAHIVDNPNFTIAGVLSVALVPGVMLSAIFVLTRNLWYVIGFHWGFNFFEAAIFGVSTSGFSFPSVIRPTLRGSPLLTGGQFGPEAGIQSVIMGVLINIVLLRMIVQRGIATTPSWLSTRLRRRSAGA